MPPTIMSFCGHCGSLLPEGLGSKSPAEVLCPNCLESVLLRESRIEGTFPDDEATKLELLYFGEEDI